MTDYEFELELSIMPGYAGIWVGIAKQKAVYVRCKQGRLHAEAMQKQLIRIYQWMRGQGHAVTPGLVRDIAVGSKERLNSLTALSVLPLVYS
ncbi:hypothetical protein LJY25_14795 [Hymenobacter sp. BT175]|uniref:hypothetical protein n=1 Tax=Hymenobacter translucens TaxID=2886507 RepID=UPI001D0F1892|nr:hypothetical protein [Hymenobacter translucens]MCC2547721.1 hypothetical protein [Hymenobacter translucens]